MMSIDISSDILLPGSRHTGRDGSGSNGRNPHQQKLKALIAALQSGDLQAARACYEAMVEFNPALAASHFQRVGHALASGNLSGAQRVIVEIYGQSQTIFATPVSSMATVSPRHSTRDDFGVLVDVSA